MARTGTLSMVMFLLGLGVCCCGEDSALRPPHGQGRLWRVLADGSGDRATIQEAIDAASPGDTIAVAEGTYRERVRLAESLRLLGGWDLGFHERDPAVHETVLDGDYSGTVLTVVDIPDTGAVVDGFVITHGFPALAQKPGGTFDLLAIAGPEGSGIWCDNASPILSGNVIRENAAPYGAGILCRRGSPRIRFNTISENSAGTSGGGILCLEFNGVVEGNWISDNDAAAEGGGLYLSASGGRILGNRIACNHAGRNGGGIVCSFSHSVFESVWVTDNTAEMYAGGVLIERAARPRFEGCSILGNRSDGSGGGVHCQRWCEPVFSNCTVGQNTAQDHGGGLYAAAGLTLFRGRIVENLAEMGGGLWCASGALVDVRRCLFEGNAAQTGGAAAVQREATLHLYRNTFVANAAPAAGGCLYLVGGETQLEANLLVDTAEGQALYCWPDAEIELWRNDFWNNVDGSFGGSCSPPPDPDPCGNFSADPLFCDPGLGEYRLQPGSPAVLADGDTLGAFDCGCGTPWEAKP